MRRTKQSQKKKKSEARRASLMEMHGQESHTSKLEISEREWQPCSSSCFVFRFFRFGRVQNGKIGIAAKHQELTRFICNAHTHTHTQTI